MVYYDMVAQRFYFSVTKRHGEITVDVGVGTRKNLQLLTNNWLHLINDTRHFLLKMNRKWSMPY